MELKVIGTGSSGNCYLLTNGQETLVIEAGLPFKAAKKVLNFNIRSIVGVIVSHVHGDHHAYSHEYRTAGISVFEPYTMESLRQDVAFGGFRVQSFDLVHNVPCCGFLISHKDFGKLLYVSDTEYLRYTFRNLNVMLIEMNYSDEYIDREAAKFRHVKTGHLEKQTTLDAIRTNASDSLSHVILCHLSASGADPDEFRAAAMEVVPIGCTVDIAVPNLTVDLSDTPF